MCPLHTSGVPAIAVRAAPASIFGVTTNAYLGNLLGSHTSIEGLADIINATYHLRPVALLMGAKSAGKAAEGIV